MCNWWLAASSRQRACSCTTSHAEFFGETSNHPGDSSLLQPRSGTLWLLAFPKKKRCLLWRRLRCHCPLYTISYIFFNKCLYFSYYMAVYLLGRSYITTTYLYSHPQVIHFELKPFITEGPRVSTDGHTAGTPFSISWSLLYRERCHDWLLPLFLGVSGQLLMAASCFSSKRLVALVLHYTILEQHLLTAWQALRNWRSHRT